MNLTKVRDWAPDDGDAPVESLACAQFKKVVLQDDDGIHFGWEDGPGKLYLGTCLSSSAARQAEAAELEAASAVKAAARDAQEAEVDAVRAKREAGTPLTDADRDLIADLVLGRIGPF